MVIATGVNKFVTLKKQSALGSQATGASGKSLRRVESTIDLKKATYSSNEIHISQQVQDMRHGIRSVAGTIKGELSVGGYQGPMESVLRQAVQAVSTTGALTNVTAATGTAPAGTFTRAAGSFLSDGFKIGDVVSWTNWATTGTANNGHNMVITDLTATVMTCYPIDGVAVAAKASGDSVTCSLVGKKTWVPATGQTRDYYTIEHWFSDIAQSEQFTDCVFTGCTITMPASGMVTVEFPVMGLNMVTGTTQSLTSPAAPPNGGIEASVNGIILVAGVKVGTMTDLTIKIDGGYSVPGGVVGSNADPDVFPGTVKVDGQFTIFFDSATMRDMFLAETEFSIVCVLTTTSDKASPFTSFVMSRCKATGADKNDGTTGLKLTVPYMALENTTSLTVANLDTTISIQDSAFV